MRTIRPGTNLCLVSGTRRGLGHRLAVWAALASSCLVVETDRLCAQVTGLPTQHVRLPQALPGIAVRERLVLGPAVLDAGVITTVTAGPTGIIVVADRTDQRLTAFAPEGGRLRVVGRKGSGPGEFQQIAALGWSGDTLVVLDGALWRATFVQPATGEIIAMHAWPDRAIPEAVLSAGQAALGVFVARPVVSLGGSNPTVVAPTDRMFRELTTAGVSETRFRDTSSVLPNHRCEDRHGTVRVLRPLFHPRGLTYAVTPDTALVRAERSQYAFTVHRFGDPRSLMRVSRPFQARAVASADWDSLSAGYRAALARAGGTMNCNPRFDRPTSFPVIDAAAIDERGRLWLEVVEADGQAIHVVGLDGTVFGRFRLPDRDATVPWFVRNSSLYFVTVGEDGLQSVRALTVAIQ